MEARDNNYAQINGSKIYKAGIYLRLSREDDDGSSQSQSILNQKDFLTSYAIENGFNIIDFYIDDGYSGTNFDRPDFQRMTEDIEKGKINAVITKDLSRLGRDYITTGYYLEKYFPLHNIRYIAINDGIDTYIETNNDMTPFKAVINDMYAKDISRKVRTALRTKKLKGQHASAFPPYGYKKDIKDKNKLVIDEEPARIVRRIFKMFIEKPSALGIAKDLSSEKVPTPSEYKKIKSAQKKFKSVWNDYTIKRILTNQTYIGNLTQNQTQKLNYKVKKKIFLPEDQWITVKNTHEAIITEEEFNTVQKLIAKKSYHANDTPIYEHLLSGLIYCGDCGCKMTFLRNPQKLSYIICQTWKRNGRLHLCTSHRIQEKYLEGQVISALKEIAAQYIDQTELLDNNHAVNYKKTIDRLSKEKSEIQKQIDEIKNIISNLYKDKIRNVITENAFIEMAEDFNNQREVFAARLDNILKEISVTEDAANNNKSHEQYLKDFLSFKNADRTTFVNLIDKIEIFDDKRVIIKFNFADPREKN